jgi:hypothetical protein
MYSSFVSIIGSNLFGKFDPQKIALPERLPPFDMKCVLDERGGQEGESCESS